MDTESKKEDKPQMMDANTKFFGSINGRWTKINAKVVKRCKEVARLKQMENERMAELKKREMAEQGVEEEVVEEMAKVGQLENVRKSNFAYNQTKIAEYISVYFACIGLGSSIVAYEIRYEQEEQDLDGDEKFNPEIEDKEWVLMLLWVTLASTIMLLLSTFFNYILYVPWQKTKLILSENDNLFNSGIYRRMLSEMFVLIFMPLPFLYGVTYTESKNTFSDLPGIYFHLNDILLCVGIFLRIYLISRAILSISFYTDPRAQRVCGIYGCDANCNFAVKCMMKVYSARVLVICLILSVLIFAFNLRLFERPLSESSG